MKTQEKQQTKDRSEKDQVTAERRKGKMKQEGENKRPRDEKKERENKGQKKRM